MHTIRMLAWRLTRMRASRDQPSLTLGRAGGSPRSLARQEQRRLARDDKSIRVAHPDPSLDKNKGVSLGMTISVWDGSRKTGVFLGMTISVSFTSNWEMAGARIDESRR